MTDPASVPDNRPTALFVCVHNAGRSQMAAGYLQHLAGDRIRVLSAGSEPADRVNPAAVAAMAEEGIDIATRGPQLLSDTDVRAADVVVTMGCGDACPFYPGTRYEDWPLDDPAGLGVEAVRPIRDQIKQRVLALIGSLDEDAPTADGHARDRLSRAPQLSDRLGAGDRWMAYEPSGAEEDDDLLDLTVSGDVIRLMWDHEVGSPLWDREGKLPEEREWLTQALGISVDLIVELERWAADANTLETGYPPRPDVPSRHDLDRRADELVERLTTELGGRYRVIYKP